MYLTIKDWKLVHDSETKRYMANTKDGKYVLEKYKRKRTNPQNRYLRGWVYRLISKYTWEDEEIIHAQMWYKFLKHKSRDFERIRSTTELSTVEFNEYVEKIILFWWEFAGLNFPTPEEFKSFSHNI